MRRILAIATTVLVLLVVGSCGDGGTGTATQSAGDGAAAISGDLTVFAAASLTDAFRDVAAAFEEETGLRVTLNLAASSSLREQILEGAPADVFASANDANMDQLVDAGEVDGPQVFATNGLRIVTPAGNPAGVTGLDDLGDPSLLIGLCAEQVPCGDFGRQALAAAGVTPAPDTDEPDVRALLTKVAAGELDAGLVYVSDVVAAGDRVEGIEVPSAFDVLATYPIGVVSSSTNRAAAEAFVAFVLGDEGRSILQRWGFGRP